LFDQIDIILGFTPFCFCSIYLSIFSVFITFFNTLFQINAVIDCVREESKHPGALYVFGAYAIGKERVFMAAAEELNMKVSFQTKFGR
jgi:hypothetical protein